MSRIGKKPVIIPAGVTITVTGNSVHVKGPKGEMTQIVPAHITIEVKDGVATLARENDTYKNLHGTLRTLVSNMVEGVTKGYEKKLDIQGVGYKAVMKGKDLELALGFSHPVNVKTPNGLSVEIDKEKKNLISVKGIDKQAVGEFAAKLRSLKKPEPYKGKGIRYEGEVIKKKAGKTVAGASGGAK